MGDDFEKALRAENEGAKDDRIWKSVIFSSRGANEARRNIEESMKDTLEDWKKFLLDPETIEAIKALPEWRADEEKAFVEQARSMQGDHVRLSAADDVLRVAGETDIDPDPVEEDEVIRKNLLLCIKKEVVAPLFAEHLAKINKWDHETARARAIEFLTELDKTLE